MAYNVIKTEHAGAKSSDRKTGYWGPRAIAKWQSSRLRRRADKIAVRESR